MASRPDGLDSTTFGDGQEPPDTDSVGSYPSDNEVESGARLCQWRTSEFHDQECHRYFDCPSHLVERELSADHPAEEHNISEGGNIRDTNVGMAGTSSRHHVNESLGSNTGRIENDQGHGENIVASGSTAVLVQETPGSTPEDAETHPRLYHTINLPDRTLSESRNRIRSQDEHSDQDESNRASEGLPPHYAELDRDRADTEAVGGSGVTRENTSGDATHNHRPTSTPGGRMLRGPISSPSPLQHRGTNHSGTSEFTLPRWQPDAEVTYCPICHTQFSIFVRKHHCRKCGRVVCNSCSPHRIIIPHQFIVRPPGTEMPLPQSLLIDGLGAGYVNVNGLSGGERVRLCNPCVPDPNTAPPQSPVSNSVVSSRSARHRSRSSLGGAFPTTTSTNRYGVVFAPNQTGDAHRHYSSRTRSITMLPDPASQRAVGGSSSRRRTSATYQSPLERLLAVGPSSLSSATTNYSSRRAFVGEGTSSSRQRALPPPPQIAEEDECPICHQELPSRTLTNFEALRESHINNCVHTHSTYGSPRGGGGDSASQAAPRLTGMYIYAATEKDCIDDAECTICLEEFAVGVSMARLECLCRFHRACIGAWFVNHPGHCPVHQHDGFGY